MSLFINKVIKIFRKLRILTDKAFQSSVIILFQTLYLNQLNKDRQFTTRNVSHQNKQQKAGNLIRIIFYLTQIFTLLESVVYTFASLEAQNIFYKDVYTENIYLTKNKKFQIDCKLFPNELLHHSTYERLLTIQKRGLLYNQFFNFSPQMIIAYRAKQRSFKDQNLIKKSSVFALGIVFLQISTLQQANQFDDCHTLDIYQEVIEESLNKIHQMYGPLLTTFIANMLDFDYEERIEGFSQLAKWILYQFQEYKAPQSHQPHNKSNCHISQKTFNKSLTSKRSQFDEQQTLPVCMIKQTEQSQRSKSRSQIQDSLFDKNKQNSNKSNRIEIKEKQVSIYVSKNTVISDGKTNIARVMHSPFLHKDYKDRQTSRIYQNRGKQRNYFNNFQKRTKTFQTLQHNKYQKGKESLRNWDLTKRTISYNYK